MALRSEDVQSLHESGTVRNIQSMLEYGTRPLAIGLVSGADTFDIFDRALNVVGGVEVCLCFEGSKEVAHEAPTDDAIFAL